MQNKKKQKALCFLLLFSLSFILITFCTYFLFLKNGKSLIWNYDGIKQHYAALCYLGNYYREVVSGFLSGDFSLPMFDFSLGMGEDIITTLNFYGLGDPLTLLAAFVPEEKTEYLYDFLVIFRMYLAGLSFSWFCREKKQGAAPTFIGALVYTFSGYVLHVAVKHPFFVIPMIFLPPAVIGVDRVLNKERLTLLITVVFLTALNGFYFFYMNTVFLVIYAMVKVICRSYRKGALAVGKDMASGAARCLVSYITGIFMAGIFFLPSVMAYLTGARSESAFDPGNLLFFDAKRYSAMVTRLIGTPRITWDYLGMASLMLPSLVLLFAGRGKKNRELKVNVILWTALMLIPFGGYLLNGFSYVSGRFLYLVTFVYAAGTVYVLPELLRMTKKKWVICGVTMLVYAAAVGFSPDADEWYGWFGLLMLAVTFFTLLAENTRLCRKKMKDKSRYAVLGVIVAVNVIGNGWLLFGSRGQGYVQSFVDSGTAYETIASTPEAEAGQTDRTTTFWRTDASEKSTENTGMITGRYGVSSYFSISNASRIEYLLQVEDGGVLDSMFKIEGLDDRTYLEALASVRYYAAEAGDEAQVPYGFHFVKEFERGNKTYHLYENTYFLPLGITYDSCLLEDHLDEETKTDGLKMQEIMMKTLVLKKMPEGISEAEAPQTGESEIPYEIVKTQNVKVEQGKIVVNKKGGSITIRKKGRSEQAEWYVSLKGFEITRKNRTYCGITVKSGQQKKTMQALTNQWNWFFGRENYLFCMGTSGETNDRITISFECGGELALEDLKVYAVDLKEYEQAVSERQRETLENLSIGTNSVAGTITVNSPQMLFFSIPYSSGWKAFINGEEVPVYQANTAYMAVQLKEGDNSVSLRYETPYLRIGAVMSLFGVISLIRYLLLSGRHRRRKFAGGGREKSEKGEAQ